MPILQSHWRYLIFVFAKNVYRPLRFIIAYIYCLLGFQKERILEKQKFKFLLLINCKGDEDYTLCTHVPDISVHINVVLFKSDKTSGCYGNLCFPKAYNEKMNIANFCCLFANI